MIKNIWIESVRIAAALMAATMVVLAHGRETIVPALKAEWIGIKVQEQYLRRMRMMQSKQQKWAKERNFLIFRVKGLISHQHALKSFLPDSESQMDIRVMLRRLETLLDRIKKMDEFAKYQRYMKDNGFKI